MATLLRNSGFVKKSGDTLTGPLIVNNNVGIGSTNPLTLLELNNTNYTGPILRLNSGVQNSTTQMSRSIGKPLIQIGGNSYSTTSGDYYGIGFGYSPNLTDKSCCEIGTIITDKTGNELGDLVFSTRDTNTNVAATERMRIKSIGDIVLTQYPSVGGFYQQNEITTNNPTARICVNNTAGWGYQDVLTSTVKDVWNSCNSITKLTSWGAALSTNNHTGSFLIDASYNTNNGNSSKGTTFKWQDSTNNDVAKLVSLYPGNGTNMSSMLTLGGTGTISMGVTRLYDGGLNFSYPTNNAYGGGEIIFGANGWSTDSWAYIRLETHTTAGNYTHLAPNQVPLTIYSRTGVYLGNTCYAPAYLLNSDRRVKNSIKKFKYTNNLDKLLQLEPVSYKFNQSDVYDNNKNRRKYGFIAQDMSNIFPEIIYEHLDTLPLIETTCTINSNIIYINDMSFLSNININDTIRYYKINDENKRNNYNKVLDITSNTILIDSINYNSNINICITGKDINMMAINYNELSPVIIKSISELYNKFTLDINRLQEKYDLLEAKLSSNIILQ